MHFIITIREIDEEGNPIIKKMYCENIHVLQLTKIMLVNAHIDFTVEETPYTDFDEYIDSRQEVRKK